MMSRREQLSRDLRFRYAPCMSADTNMNQDAVSAAQAVDAFLGSIPRVISPAVLEEYGITATASQAQHVSRECLLVSLFWVGSAVHAAMPAKDVERIMNALQDRLTREWKTAFEQPEEELEAFLIEIPARRRMYDQIVQEGGSPVAVLSETGAVLAAAATIHDEDRSKLLALFIDLVPVDDLGAMAAEMTLSD
jgi:hypothetical protein